MQELALLFEPDGYFTNRKKIIGRASAGSGFLRAVSKAFSGKNLYACTNNRDSAEIFKKAVREFEPASRPGWIYKSDLSELSRVGTLYLPDPVLGDASRLRARISPSAYSLTGVTHTIASLQAMQKIAAILKDPVMPWDALICTSKAAQSAVNNMFSEEAEYLRWRFGDEARITLPMLPIIPLGIHVSDFTYTSEDRLSSRKTLNIREDEILIFYTGRLSSMSKSHPYPMYAGLQKAVESTGKKIALLQCGCFPDDQMRQQFENGARDFCPNVRCLFVDGLEENAQRRGWMAADIFMSLSDNIQETFGLTPVEAMAAGLPVIVSDWSGYRDTVRHNVDGFCIRTSMPDSLWGESLARDYEGGRINYSRFCGLTAHTVSVDFEQLVQSIIRLVENPALRKEMGRDGRSHAVRTLDWMNVMKQYEDLWAVQTDIRRRAHANIRFNKASQMDPFKTFKGFSSLYVDKETQVSLIHGVDITQSLKIVEHSLFSHAPKIKISREILTDMLQSLVCVSSTIQVLSEEKKIDVQDLIIIFSLLAKIGIVRFECA